MRLKERETDTHRNREKETDRASADTITVYTFGSSCARSTPWLSVPEIINSQLSQFLAAEEYDENM